MTAGQAAALAPVRDHLLAEAREEAGRIVAAARAEAEAITEQARQAGEGTVLAARSEGAAAGAALAAAERGRGRARARAIVLAARREAQLRLREEIAAALARLPDEPGYAGLLSRLSALAADAAGPGASVARSPAGGVVARSGQVVVDCSLPRLADLAIEALGGRVRELWTP